MQTISDQLKPILADLLLAVADDKLMLGHRNSDWTGLGPILEEDIAFSSLAQDELAHASALYELAGELLGATSDELAFGRAPTEYRCASITVVPDEFDWATAICRQFFCDHFDLLRLNRLARSECKPLADLSSRLAAEEQVHVEHSNAWIVRLGKGTDESKQRMQAALDALAPLAPMLFEPIESQDELEEEELYPGFDTEMYEKWSQRIMQVIEEAGLTVKLRDALPEKTGGRRGQHDKHLERLLDEMCEVYRTEPGVAW